jgi:hypothetical protein
MDILMKSVFGRGKGIDKDLMTQMRMFQQTNQMDELGEIETEKNTIYIDYKQFDELNFDDDLDSDRE